MDSYYKYTACKGERSTFTHTFDLGGKLDILNAVSEWRCHYFNENAGRDFTQECNKPIHEMMAILQEIELQCLQVGRKSTLTITISNDC